MATRAAECLLILAVSAAALPCLAQPSPDLPEARTFRFVATGPKGEPVTDLKPEEVQITDNGKRQPLLFAHLLGSGDGAGPAALGPRELSNHGHEELFSSTLLLLDLLNANIDERGAAWNETVQAVSALESAGNVYLYLLAPDATLYPVHAWNSREAASGPPAWPGDAKALLSAALGKVERIKPTELTAAPGLTVEPTYNAFRLLAQQYAALPGQKRIIWATHGLPMTIVGPNGTVYADFHAELRALAQEFVELGISVYTVHQLDRSTTGIGTDETLQTLAPLTAGRWFENDAVERALTQARADARATYQAAYAVTAKEIDGKFHKLRASCTRKNVRILPEEGYIAAPPQDMAKSRLDLATSRPYDTPDIGLRAAISNGDKAGTLHFEIGVDVRDLAFEHTGSSSAGQFSTSILFFNSSGAHVPAAPAVTQLNFSQDQLDAALKNGYRIASDQAVPPGAARGRIVVQDNLSGLAGSLGFSIESK